MILTDFKNDGSPTLSKIISDHEISYLNFKKNLIPQKKIIFKDLLIIFSMFLFGVIIAHYISIYSTFFSVLFFTVYGTFWLKAYLTFFHEAAHFNFYPGKRKLNDILSNFFLSPFIGMSVKSYRKTHWEHHKNLGSINDTEISYFEPLEFRKLIDILTLNYLFQTFLRYRENYKKKSLTDFNFFLIIFVVINILFIFIAYMLDAYYFIFSWVFIYLYGIPLTEKIRQTLEHRDFNANPAKNYKKENHGPVNRLFGKDFFSRFFGAAGFNRHLLHHYDPSISYTNFDEVENFFLKSNLKNHLIRSKTTYFACLLNILKYKKINTI